MKDDVLSGKKSAIFVYICLKCGFLECFKLVLEFVLEFSVQRRITGKTVEGIRVPQVEEVCLMLLFVNSKQYVVIGYITCKLLV